MSGASGNDDTALADTAAPVGETIAASGTAPAATTTGQVELAVVDRAHYEVLGEFGRGGLGRVLRARDRRIGRIVAVKEVLRQTPDLLARFAREAIVTARLQHPAIVPVYEVGRWPSGEPFYAMKLVAGRSLADAVRATTTLRDRLALLAHVVAVADALAYAHGQRVLHRDLKPANVLVGDFGETVVIDWGLAKHLDDPDRIEPSTPEAGADGATIAGSVLGTPGYMPPEQARGDRVDERGDVYAIGALLYETLAGVRPYADTRDPAAILVRTETEPPRALAEIDPDIPAELIAIAERAMAFDPALRYRTAKALADDLKRFTTGQLVGAQRYTAWMLIRRWLRKHRAIVAVAGAALAAIAVIAVISVRRIGRARDRALAAQAEAVDRAAALAEEHGRELLIGGEAARALPFLADAVARGRRSPALDFELARTLDRLAGVEAVFPGNGQPVDEVAYSPDGNYVASTGEDFVVHIWDVHAHALARTLGEGTGVAWSPDGRFVASIDRASRITVRDPATGRALATLPAPPEGTTTLAISPDSAWIAVGGVKGAITWQRADGSAPPVTVHAHSAPIHRLAFSRDSRRLVAASDDHRATTWDLAAGKRLATVQLADVVRDAELAPDGASFATAGVDGTLVVWDAVTGAKLRAFAGPASSVESAHFSPDGARLVASYADGTVVVWDAATGVRLGGFAATGVVLDAVYSRDGARIAARTDRGLVVVLDAAAQPLAVLSGHVGSIGDVAWSPDGAQLASGGLDGDVRLWRSDGGHAITALAIGGTKSWRGAWSPDGARIALPCQDGVLRVFDGESGALVRELTAGGGEVTYAAFSPDGTRVASANADGTAIVWNAASGAKLATLAPGAGRTRFVGFSPDGNQLATAHADGTARLWDARTFAPAGVLAPSGGKARRIAWSPDGARLVTPQDGGGATLWTSQGTAIAGLPLDAELTTAVAWSPDGGELVIGGDDTEVRRYDGHTGAPRGALVGHTVRPIRQAAYAPDGSAVATAGGDGLVRRWRDGEQIDAIGDASYMMTAVAYRPDGALLATGGLDADVWDARTGQLVGVLPGGSPDAQDVALTELQWSPDGTRLLVLSLGLAPRLWHVPTWRGTSADIAARMRCALRERLDGTRLITAVPDPSACR